MNKIENSSLNRFGDILIKVGDECLYMNQELMMEKSEYFKAMLTHNTIEKSKGVVELKEVEYKAVGQCFEYMKEKEPEITLYNSEELLQAASIMQLDQLKNSIAENLTQNLNHKTFFDTKRIAEKFFLDELGDTCDEFAVANLEEIVKEKSFNELEMEYVLFLLDSVSPLNTNANDSKLLVILHWTLSDSQNRGRYLKHMIQRLNLTKISSGLRKYIFYNEKIIVESKEMRNILGFGRKTRARLSLRPGVTWKVPEISFSTQANAMLGFSIREKRFWTYNPSRCARKRTYVSPKKVDAIAATSVRNWIYFVNKKGECCKVNPWKKKCIELLDLPRECVNLSYLSSAVFLRGFVYFASGDCLSRYIEATGEWEVFSKSPRWRDASLVVYKENIYVIGGSCSLSPWRFHPADSTWEPLNPMPIGRIHPTAVGHGNKIFISGGSGCAFLHGWWNDEHLTAVEYFDPKCNLWSKIASPFSGYDNLNLCAVGGKLFAVGRICDESKTAIEVYDEGKWKKQKTKCPGLDFVFPVHMPN